jgi:hypothetical protein
MNSGNIDRNPEGIHRENEQILGTGIRHRHRGSDWGFMEDERAARGVHGVRVAFLHGFPPLNPIKPSWLLLTREHWLNSPPLTPALRGKVVLMATHASLRPRLGRKYRNQKLVVIGVHAPGSRLKKHRQHSLGREGDAGQLSGRSGQ